jgi:hypothetical protein
MACAGLTALTAPKAEGIAHAEQITDVERDFRFSVSGETTMMREGEESRQLNIVSRQLDHYPEVEIEGPATLTVTFYPAVLREWFGEEDQQVSRTIRYRMANGGEGREQVFSGDVSLSDATSPDIPRMVIDESGEEGLNPLAIGTAIVETIEIPEGMHTLRIVAPNGLVSFDAQQIVRESAPVEVPEPVEPEPPPVVAAQPAQIPQTPQRRISVVLDGERSHLNFIGSHGSTGDLNNIYAYADIGLSERLGMISGASFASYGIDYPSDRIGAQLRSFNASAMAGPSLTLGPHQLYAAAVLGYNGVSTDAQFHSDGARGTSTHHTFHYGGEFGYGFDRWLRLRIAGGSDPIMPLSAHIYGALPQGYGHGREAHASATLDIRYMHLPVAVQEGGSESIEIMERNMFGRLSLSAPFWAFRAGNGIIIPAALLAGDINISSEGFHSIDMQLGAGLEARAGGFEIMAAGAVSPFTAAPFFLLRTSFRR